DPPRGRGARRGRRPVAFRRHRVLAGEAPRGGRARRRGGACAHAAGSDAAPGRPGAPGVPARALPVFRRVGPTPGAWDGDCMNTDLIIESLAAVRRAILDNEVHIESLDRAIGDGDHFINVRRGCEVLVAMSPDLHDAPPSVALQKIGLKLLGTIGGAS